MCATHIPTATKGRRKLELGAKKEKPVKSDRTHMANSDQSNSVRRPQTSIYLIAGMAQINNKAPAPTEA